MELQIDCVCCRRRRKSSTGSSLAAGPGLTPSPRAAGRPRLRVSLAGPSRRTSGDGATTATPLPPTLSELSEAGRTLSPRSPLYEILNVREISEVLDEVESDKEEEQQDEELASHRLSDLIITQAELNKNASNLEKTGANSKQGKNPFHFSSSRLSMEKSDSEPKKNQTKKTIASNKKRKEILESKSNSVSVVEEVQYGSEAQAATVVTDQNKDADGDEEDTLKEEVENEVMRKPRRRWERGGESEPVRQWTMMREPSQESAGCYYCRTVCPRHQPLLLPPRTAEQEGVARGGEGVARGGEGVVGSGEGAQPVCSEAGVQAGRPAVHHYLFDPTADALFDSGCGVGLRPGGQGGPGDSVMSLLRRQLEFTEQQLRSQQQLYRSFCRALEQSTSKPASQGDRILFGRTERPKKLTFDEALKIVKREMREEEEARRGRPRSAGTGKHSSKTGSKRNISRKSKMGVEKNEDDSICESIKEEIENANYEMDFENDSEIPTETSISTEIY